MKMIIKKGKWWLIPAMILCAPLSVFADEVITPTTSHSSGFGYNIDSNVDPAAQIITVTGSGTISSVDAYISWNNNTAHGYPNDTRICIYTDMSGSPGSSLGCSNWYSHSDLPSSDDPLVSSNFVFTSPLSITPGDYWVVFQGNGSPISPNYYTYWVIWGSTTDGSSGDVIGCHSDFTSCTPAGTYGGSSVTATAVALTVVVDTGGGGGSTTTATSTDSTVDNPNLDIGIAVIVFMYWFAFTVWALTKK